MLLPNQTTPDGEATKPKYNHPQHLRQNAYTHHPFPLRLPRDRLQYHRLCETPERDDANAQPLLVAQHRHRTRREWLGSQACAISSECTGLKTTHDPQPRFECPTHLHQVVRHLRLHHVPRQPEHLRDDAHVPRVARREPLGALSYPLHEVLRRKRFEKNAKHEEKKKARNALPLAANKEGGTRVREQEKAGLLPLVTAISFVNDVPAPCSTTARWPPAEKNRHHHNYHHLNPTRKVRAM